MEKNNRRHIMLYRILFLLLLNQLATPLTANMASPIQEGTLGGRTFISKHVDVTSESIFIQPDSIFNSAFIHVKYQINTDTTGLLIPLLFHATEYLKGIDITFDQQKIDLDNCFLADYNHLPNVGLNPDDDILIKWDDDSYLYEEVNDLKYFEIHLTKGSHTIEISYYADVWVDRSDWVKSKSIRYSLSPIKHWKSVGEIAVTIDFSKTDTHQATINTNLGSKYRTQEPNIKTWLINATDEEYIKITYQPKVSVLSKALIKISPSGIALIAILLFIFLHAKLIKATQSHLSFVVFAGALAVPILSFIVYLYAYSLIDATLKDNASRFHGYTFLMGIFLPFIMIIYGLLINRYSKTLHTQG